MLLLVISDCDIWCWITLHLRLVTCLNSFPQEDTDVETPEVRTDIPKLRTCEWLCGWTWWDTDKQPLSTRKKKKTKQALGSVKALSVVWVLENLWILVWSSRSIQQQPRLETRGSQKVAAKIHNPGNERTQPIALKTEDLPHLWNVYPTRCKKDDPG